MPNEIDRLLSIMARLRDKERGCEWDVAQSYETIAPYTIEEAYEVADAIERADMDDLRGELGDLLLQVVFHARMAEEEGLFDFHAVAKSISDKMVARHPHVFGDEPQAGLRQRWEDQKEAERAEKGATSAMDGVALALPALLRAEKLQKRAARIGFDWPDTTGPKAKIAEELAELEEAAECERLDEAGDLLFAVVNLVRKYGIDPEQALRSANSKFEGRFRAMEDQAKADAVDFATLTLDEQESYWQKVKKNEI